MFTRSAGNLMRKLAKALQLAVPMAIVAASALVPMPLSWSIGGMIFGLLFFQLALVGSLDGFLPSQRRYGALRTETERLLDLVRELNHAVVEARALGVGETRYTEPIVRQIHEVIDGLPIVAGLEDDAGRTGPVIH